MANLASARKRARQAVKARAHNMALRSRVRTSMKAVLAAVKDGDKDKATAAYAMAVPVIDKMVNKGILHKNQAARHKSRLNAKVKAL
ncbi:MAG: 30S ribosomal protein S20 [Pseudomonadota bacterium]